jgi:long-chain fatty acid transport protein
MVKYGFVDKNGALRYHADVFSSIHTRKRRKKMRTLCIFVVVLVTCAAAVSVFASGIDNKTNWSAGYARTMNRNAVYDSADAAVYNPAGVGMMEKGFYVSAHNQFAPKDYSHESSPSSTEYSTENATLFLPSAFVVYKREKLGFYGAFYIPAGGGTLEYDDGIVDLNEGIGLDPFGPSGDVSSVYYAGTVGAVFAFNDAISVSAGLRYMYAVQTTKFETESTMLGLPGPLALLNGDTLILDSEASASGFDAVIGLDIAPLKGLNIGVRYETRTGLEWEYTKVEGDLATLQGIAEGDTYNRDLPSLLGVGASYMITPKLKAEASLDVYFNKSADWEGDEEDVSNGFAAGAAGEYAFFESKLKASFGFLYTKTGADSDSFIHLNPALNSFTIAGGALWRITEDLNVELGVMKPFYTGDDGSSTFPASNIIDVSLDKSLWIIALGLQYKIF